jgi:hypothetical protein
MNMHGKQHGGLLLRKLHEGVLDAQPFVRSLRRTKRMTSVFVSKGASIVPSLWPLEKWRLRDLEGREIAAHLFDVRIALLARGVISRQQAAV